VHKLSSQELGDYNIIGIFVLSCLELRTWIENLRSNFFKKYIEVDDLTKSFNNCTTLGPN
jgi:hypothetical protein